jgi:hypothetical protein
METAEPEWVYFFAIRVASNYVTDEGLVKTVGDIYRLGTGKVELNV